MAASTPTPATAVPAGQPRVPALLGLAAVVGLASGGGVVAFISVEHAFTHLLWHDLPDAFGWEEPQWWWVYLVLMVGAVGVWASLKLPGKGGHRPLDGLGFDIGPDKILSVICAALVTLSVGAVVGPEMPLMAVGSAIGALIGSRLPPQQRTLLMMAGAMAAITMILGNPMVVAILILESMALRGSPGGKAAMLSSLSALMAMCTGYLFQVGAGDWPGFGEAQLTIDGLPPYTEVGGVDALLMVPVALVTGLVTLLALSGGHAVQRWAELRPLPVIVAAAAVVATCAVVADKVGDLTPDFVLFSGQDYLSEILLITSAATLLLVLVTKAIAYAVTLGSGFRGGAIFPAIYLGIVVATFFAGLNGGANLSALTAAGIAAAVGTLLRLPFTAAALALLLCVGTGLTVTVPAIAGAVIGVLLRQGFDVWQEKRTVAAAA